MSVCHDMAVTSVAVGISIVGFFVLVITYFEITTTKSITYQIKLCNSHFW